ncbi:MAG: DUF2779 domain-containing protein, partial [Spirochaetota bacterium]
PKSLWLYRYRKDLAAPFSKETEQRLNIGHNVGELAQQYFQERGPTVEVHAPFWDVEGGACQTRSFLAEGEDVIFEATAALDQAYSRIDVLRRKPYGQMELIEVKAATKVKPYHIDDMSFQYHVFSNAGYAIDACYMMLINTGYTRQGPLELDKLFQFCDVSTPVRARGRKVLEASNQFSDMLGKKVEPQIEMGNHCSRPFECVYVEYCQKLRQRPKGELFPKAVSELENISEEGGEKKSKVPKRYQIRPDMLRRWLDALRYPLYFLDYECCQSPLPMFDQSRPYQVIPFQFSLHIQPEENAALQHVSFLYMGDEPGGERDPRKPFIHKLLEHCGSEGSIVVYNQSFEASVNRSLARDFPSYKEALFALNARMKDMHVPFGKYWLYSPLQRGGTSLKTILPIYTSFSYEDIAMNNGLDAMNAYLAFLQGAVPEPAELRADLEEYCRLDTLALYLLLVAIKQELTRKPIISSFPSSGQLLDIPH